MRGSCCARGRRASGGLCSPQSCVIRRRASSCSGAARNGFGVPYVSRTDDQYCMPCCGSHEEPLAPSVIFQQILYPPIPMFPASTDVRDQPGGVRQQTPIPRPPRSQPQRRGLEQFSLSRPMARCKWCRAGRTASLRCNKARHGAKRVHSGHELARHVYATKGQESGGRPLILRARFR
jgi:hypothetical protein